MALSSPDSSKTRPTGSRTREALFNILQGVEGFRVLDLFAGTGSISLEFLSRGCGRVVSVEKDYKHYQFLQRTCRQLGDKAWMPLHADVFKYVQRASTQFDIIFADPPYALENLADIPSAVFGAKLLAPDGIFILEHGKDYSFENDPHFLEHRNYGSVNFTFFQKKEV